MVHRSFDTDHPSGWAGHLMDGFQAPNTHCRIEFLEWNLSEWDMVGVPVCWWATWWYVPVMTTLLLQWRLGGKQFGLALQDTWFPTSYGLKEQYLSSMVSAYIVEFFLKSKWKEKNVEYEFLILIFIINLLVYSSTLSSVEIKMGKHSKNLDVCISLDKNCSFRCDK